MTMYLPGPRCSLSSHHKGHAQLVAHPTSFVSHKPGPRQSPPAPPPLPRFRFTENQRHNVLTDFVPDRRIQALFSDLVS